MKYKNGECVFTRSLATFAAGYFAAFYYHRHIRDELVSSHEREGCFLNLPASKATAGLIENGGVH